MSDSDEEAVEKQVKVVILGEASAGKTCLIARYCHNDFSRQYLPTAGVDFFLKRTVLSGARNITLKIWDVGGVALAGNMLDKYVFGANVIILVYDVTNAASFECLEDWLEAVRTVTSSQNGNPMITIIGNKCDMEHQRTVRADAHQRFAQEHGLSSHVVSARTGENVASAFQRIVAEALGVRLSRAELEDHQTVMRAELVHVATESQAVRATPAPLVKPTVLCVIQ